MAPKASSAENIGARRAPHAFNSYQYTIAYVCMKEANWYIDQLWRQRRHLCDTGVQKCLERVPRASSSSGDSCENPWFHGLRFMDFFGSPRGEFTGTTSQNTLSQTPFFLANTNFFHIIKLSPRCTLWIESCKLTIRSTLIGSIPNKENPINFKAFISPSTLNDLMSI